MSEIFHNSLLWWWNVGSDDAVALTLCNGHHVPFSRQSFHCEDGSALLVCLKRSVNAEKPFLCSQKLASVGNTNSLITLVVIQPRHTDENLFYFFCVFNTVNLLYCKWIVELRTWRFCTWKTKNDWRVICSNTIIQLTAYSNNNRSTIKYGITSILVCILTLGRQKFADYHQTKLPVRKWCQNDVV